MTIDEARSTITNHNIDEAKARDVVANPSQYPGSTVVFARIVIVAFDTLRAGNETHELMS